MQTGEADSVRVDESLARRLLASRTGDRLLTIAERSPRRAARLAARLAAASLGDDQDAQLRALTILYHAWAALRWERLVDAQALLGDARIQLDKLRDEAALHICHYVELTLAQARGAAAGLQTELYRLASELEAAGQHREAVSVRLNQAAHLNALGRPRETLDAAAALAPIVVEHGHARDCARLDRITAIAYGMIGDTEQAQALLARSERQYSVLRQPADVAKCQLERAWAQMRRDQLDEAAATLRAALRTFVRCDLPLQSANCHRNLGAIANRQARFGEALAETSRARDDYIAARRLDHAASCDLEIGNVAYYSGLFEIAAVAYQRARAAYTELGIDRLALISQRNEALALRSQGRHADALTALRAIERGAMRVGDRLELVELVYAEAQLLADIGEVETAAGLLQQARERFAALGAPASAASCQLEQAWLALRQGDAEAAAATLEAAAGPLSGRPDPSWRLDYGRGRASEMRGDVAGALAAYQRACATIADMRSTLASEHASSALFSQARQLHRDALRLAAELGRAADALDLIEQQRALALHHQLVHTIIIPPELRRELDERRRRLEELSTAGAAQDVIDGALQRYIELVLRQRHIQPTTDFTMQVRLDRLALCSQLDTLYPEGWVALSYTHLEEEILIISLDRSGCMLTRTPCDNRLRRLLDRATQPKYRWLTYLAGSSGQGSDETWSTLAALGALLLPDSVRERLTGETRLLIVPDGPLHSIPWAALRCGQQWLCERAVVQLLPSLTLWDILAARRPAGEAALLIGCSQFGGRGEELPHVPAELSAVADQWPGKYRRLDDAAVRKDALLEVASRGELRELALLHIASHAQMISRQGVLAHIKLWDGDLYLDDVSALNLAGALVVLSVCHGAESAILPGDELLGLSRGLLAGGARDVVATLWETYDRGASHLLIPFYSELLRGADPAQALTYAQRALVAGVGRTDAVLASPFFWGSYCVIGASCGLGPPAGGTTPAASRTGG